MKPYTYLIKHRPTGQVYYGVRSANKVEPHEDLWNKYYTSSPKVQRLIEETGKDSFDVEVRKVFETKEQAVAWETKVLRRCKVLHDARWLNQNVAGYIIPTAESNKKISDFHKGKPKSEDHKKKIRDGNIGKKKPPRTDEYRALMSKLKSGENNPMYGKGCTPERAANISAAKKGKPAANKGVPMTEAQKQKLRDKMLGRKVDPEVIARRVKSQTGKTRTPEQRERIAEGIRKHHATKKSYK